MTAEEKANQLRNRFHNNPDIGLSQGNTIDGQYRNAVQCALVVVDEMLELLMSEDNDKRPSYTSFIIDVRIALQVM